MSNRSNRKEAAELTLALAIAGKDGAFIVRQYTIAKDGSDELMVASADREDLVADIIGDLHHIDPSISDLTGFVELEAALTTYCAGENFNYEDLKGRGERNGAYETDRPTPRM